MMNLNITKGQVVKYSFFPQVLPRFQELISSGFSNLAYFMALVYRATNILPDNHIYLKSDSIGKYTIQNVLTEAANNLIFNIKHIDQLIIFFALIAGLFILAFQFVFILLMFFINPASAGNFPTGIGEYFTTPDPENDLAFRMLDSVFGVPDFFGSREPTGTTFHQALHTLYQLYSFGLLVVAVIIILYFIFAILAETAQTGTPFGRRYNHVWAPIRLVIGIGLLVPMTLGLNAGQYITLHAAKFGSGFATTGWIIFNESINDNQYLDPESLVPEPEISDLKNVAAFMMLAHGCKQGYINTRTEFNIGTAELDAYIIPDTEGGEGRKLLPVNYQEAIDIVGGKDIHIRFGAKDKDRYTSTQGGVYPYCGEIVIQNIKPTSTDNKAENTKKDVSDILNEAYYELIKTMWTGAFQEIQDRSQGFINNKMGIGDAREDPPIEYRGTLEQAAQNEILKSMDAAIAIAEEELAEPLEDKGYGWVGAALWYNQIANVNGKFTSAAMNTPQVKVFPYPMVYTCEQNQQQNSETSPKDCNNPNLARGAEVQYESTSQANIAAALNQLSDYWYKDPADLTGNVFIDVINAILGTQGLFSMCKNDNADKHPLALLSVLGKGMIEAAIRNLGISLGSGAAGILTPYFGPLLSSASSFFTTVASIGILIGFILFYIVPFLPFLYFMFAVGGWVKGLFEAMVGVPLWALAHLRIDGEGLPGDAAINGYFLIFEIFIRPILILFGLIAALLVFGAMVKVLNDIFTIVVSNLSGFDANNGNATSCGSNGRSINEPGTVEWMRGPIDELFFTVVYAIMVYMIGMSSFKLIDLIPNNILRWMGQNVQTFNDQAGEPAEGLVSKLSVGGSVLGDQLGQAASGAGGALTNTGKALQEFAK